MHSIYTATIDELRTWAQNESGIHCALILGSQARVEFTGDEWSDLDILLLVDDPQAYLGNDTWLDFLGEAVCVIVEETPLDWLHMTWSVKRVLFADNRALDFSIMPFERVDDVLAINAEIHIHGYQVIYAEKPDWVTAKIEATLATVKDITPKIPTQEELNQAINDLLFQLIWAGKKIKRNELWVAVSWINQQISTRLLQLIEFHAAVTARTHPRIRYEGRFLEQRLSPALKVDLTHCFAKYDALDAARTLRYLIDFSERLARDISDAAKYSMNPRSFTQIRKMHGKMFGGESN